MSPKGWISTALAALFFAFPVQADNLKLEIAGAEDLLHENLRLGLSLATESCDAPAWRVRRLLRRADEELQRAARALGHYRLRVETKSLQREGECWRARFEVTPGEPVRIAGSLPSESRATVDTEADSSSSGEGS